MKNQPQTRGLKQQKNTTVPVAPPIVQTAVIVHVVNATAVNNLIQGVGKFTTDAFLEVSHENYGLFHHISAWLPLLSTICFRARGVRGLKQSSDP